MSSSFTRIRVCASRAFAGTAWMPGNLVLLPILILKNVEKKNNVGSRRANPRGTLKSACLSLGSLLLLYLFGSGHIDLDLPRLALRLFVEFKPQDPGFVIRLDAFLVNRVRDCERALEAAVAALQALEVLVVAFVFEGPLALDGQRVVFHANV